MIDLLQFGCGQARDMTGTLVAGRIFCHTQNIMSITATHKKRGRPATGITPQVNVRMPVEMAEALDLASANLPGTPSRSELIRRIVFDWLRASGHMKPGNGSE